jgi:hypothetical protein
LGSLSGRWIPNDIRDRVIDFVASWAAKTEFPSERCVTWIGVARGKFFDWRKRYGKVNEHSALVPRDHWTTRLYSAIGYIAPADFLAGRANAIWVERDRKLEAARQARAHSAALNSGRQPPYERPPPRRQEGNLPAYKPPAPQLRRVSPAVPERSEGGAKRLDTRRRGGYPAVLSCDRFLHIQQPALSRSRWSSTLFRMRGCRPGGWSEAGIVQVDCLRGRRWPPIGTKR